MFFILLTDILLTEHKKGAISHFYWRSKKIVSLPTFAPSFEPQNQKELFGHSHKKTGSNQIHKWFHSINGIDISFNRWRSMIIISHTIRKKGNYRNLKYKETNSYLLWLKLLKSWWPNFKSNLLRLWLQFFRKQTQSPNI